MFISLRRIACLLLVMALFAGTMPINGLCGAYERIFTITGEILSVKGRVIVIEGGKSLRPFHEVDIPAWAVPGARATLSYVVRSRGKLYLEIVRPGQRLKVKEEIELSRKQRY